jgi:hypothetical protein
MPDHGGFLNLISWYKERIPGKEAFMEWAALVAWVVTALGGFVLAGTWVAHGGLREGPLSGRRIRPTLVAPHFLLAASGLVIWIVYLAADEDALAWVAFALLAVVAAFGFTMFFGWLARGRGRTTEGPRPAEAALPFPVVILHGLVAATTIVLVFLTAVGVGD